MRSVSNKNVMLGAVLLSAVLTTISAAAITSNGAVPKNTSPTSIATIQPSAQMIPTTSLQDEEKKIESRADELIEIVGVWVAVITLIFLILGVMFGVSESRSAAARRAEIDALLKETKTEIDALVISAKGTKAQIDAEMEEAQARVQVADNIRREIENSKTVVEKARGEIEGFLERMRIFDVAIKESEKNVAKYFDKLLEGEQERGGGTVVNAAYEIPDEETISRMEEADTVLLVAETTTNPGSILDEQARKQRATYFIKLGKYWSSIENYPRAIARFRKAIDLYRKSWEAHISMAKTLSYLAARPLTTETEKHRLLNEAEKYIRQALHLVHSEQHALEVERLDGIDTTAAINDLNFELTKIYYSAAGIADERKDYNAAITAYKQAREYDVNNRRPEIGYNLACSYALAGRFEEALAELATVIGRNRNWELIQIDEDFDKLRKDEAYGRRLIQMVEHAKSAASPQTTEGDRKSK